MTAMTLLHRHINGFFYKYELNVYTQVFHKLTLMTTT